MTDPIAKRALILDFDGVVVETEQLHFDCWNAAYEELYGIRVGGSHNQLVGLSLQQIHELWCSATEELLVLSDDEKDQLLKRKTELFFTLGKTTLTPVSGLRSLIQCAHDNGWYVTIASRALRMRLLRTLEMLGIPAIFDLVMGSEDIVDPNTDRKVHSLAAKPFGITPENCIVIEDSASGVRSAVDCGIGTVVGLTTSLDCAALEKAGAHVVVDALVEVEKFL
ncbi:MAG: HAD family phosphatase [Chloroflexota bacterium]